MKFLLCSAFLALVTGCAGFTTAQTVSVPRPELGCSGVVDQPDNLDGAESFTFSKPAGRALRIHVLSPPDGGANRPAVVFFFGGGWRIGRIATFANEAHDLVSKGYVAALADYRVMCRDKSTIDQSVADAEAAYAWMRRNSAKFGVDPKRIVMAGTSSGGHIALVASLAAPNDQKPAAILLYNPATDLMRFAKPDEQEAARAISPSQLPLGQLPPTAIFHGTADRTVSIEEPRAFCARARSAGAVCQLNEYPGRDHSFFHDKTIDPALGFAPYDDTLAKSLIFLSAHGLSP